MQFFFVSCRCSVKIDIYLYIKEKYSGVLCPFCTNPQISIFLFPKNHLNRLRTIQVVVVVSRIKAPTCNKLVFGFCPSLTL